MPVLPSSPGCCPQEQSCVCSSELHSTLHLLLLAPFLVCCLEAAVHTVFSSASRQPSTPYFLLLHDSSPHHISVCFTTAVHTIFSSASQQQSTPYFRLLHNSSPHQLLHSGCCLLFRHVCRCHPSPCRCNISKIKCWSPRAVELCV